jgi:hypothetical protein
MLTINTLIKTYVKMPQRMVGCTITSGTQTDEFMGGTSRKPSCAQNGSRLVIPGARSQRIIKVPTCPYF